MDIQSSALHSQFFKIPEIISILPVSVSGIACDRKTLQDVEKNCNAEVLN